MRRVFLKMELTKTKLVWHALLLQIAICKLTGQFVERNGQWYCHTNGTTWELT